MKTHLDIKSQGLKHGRVFKASGNLFISKAVAKTTSFARDSNRTDIVRFSASSGRRMRQYLRECVSEYGYMVTLTYPHAFPSSGTATKEHLRRFLQELKREYERNSQKYSASGKNQPFSCFWFLEFQDRGAPHYHIFTTFNPDKKWVSRRWYEIVNSEDERHLRAGTRCEALLRGRSGTISYASKYAAKQCQKEVPAGFEHVGRFWGVCGNRAIMAAATFVESRQMNDAVIHSKVQNAKNAIRTLIKEGKARVIVSNDDTFVVALLTKPAILKMYMLVSDILGATTNIGDMFMDAELS